MQNNYSYELTDAEMQEISRRADAAIKRGDRLNLRSDGVFKSFFSKDTKESTYLRNLFISAVIGKNVARSIVKNPELILTYQQAKSARLDVYCQLEDGTSIDLEMQVGRENDDQVKRAVYYACKMLPGNLDSGQPYGSIPNVHQIMITNFALHDFPGFYHNFTFRDTDANELSAMVKIHTIELTKLHFSRENLADISHLEFFALLLKYNDEDEIISELLHIPKFKEAVAMVETVTESISKTKDEWIQQFLLDKARNDYNCYAAAHRIAGEKAGFERGREQGERIGREQGEKAGIYKTAKNFKELGIDVGTIQKATGLSAEEIASL